jgi:hypothetical protein
MNKNLIVILLSLLLTTSVFAQSEVEKERKLFKSIAIQEVIEYRQEKKAIEASTLKSIKDNPSLLAVTAADVGEPDSFDKNARFLGTAVTGVIFTHPTCSPADLANDGIVLLADDRCIPLPNPDVNTDVTFNDIGRIKIPAKTVNNTIWYVSNNLRAYFMQNTTGAISSGNMLYTPSITIESDALLDPAAIDPNTGLPMNGSYTTGIGSKNNSKTLQITEFDNVLDRYSLAATRGLARSFWSDLGLPQNVINQLYKKPMTIKLNLRVRMRAVQDGTFFYTMRFFGN